MLLCSLVTEETVLFVGDGLLADVLWRARGAVAAVCSCTNARVMSEYVSSIQPHMCTVMLCRVSEYASCRE